MGRNSASGILVVHVKGGADMVGVGESLSDSIF